MERLSILDLLPSHRSLLAHHRARLVALMRVAIEQNLDPKTMAFIVADTRGTFGVACIEADAGWEFLAFDPDGNPSMVIALGTDGLLVILAEMVSDAVEPVVTRPAGTTPILVVDADDEPALVLMPTGELTEAQPC